MPMLNPWVNRRLFQSSEAPNGGRRWAWKSLVLACRVALGGLFIWFAAPHVAHPEAFAQSIVRYDLIKTPLLVNAAAVLIPWTELAAGVYLILGVWVRGSVTALAALLAFFIALFAVTLARGMKIDCGCYGQTEVGAWTVTRNLLMMLLAACVFLDFHLMGRPAKRPVGE